MTLRDFKKKTISNNCREEIEQVLKENIYKGARPHMPGKQVGQKTQHNRRQVIFQCFNQLESLGFQMPHANTLREIHIRNLVAYWEAEGHASKTINNKLTTLRTFSDWVGKPGMVKNCETYYSVPEEAKVSTVCTEDKSWSAKEVDALEKIAEITQTNANVGACLLAMSAFGLRTREAWHLRPHIAIGEGSIHLTEGTKGGRNRTVPIETDFQREVVEYLKTFVTEKSASLMMLGKTRKAFGSTYYRVCRKHGLSRKRGLVPHGLRAEFINNKYEALSGFPSPVRGQQPGQVECELHKAVCKSLMGEVGHSRPDVFGAYGGGRSIDFSKISKQHADKLSDAP